MEFSNRQVKYGETIPKMDSIEIKVVQLTL